MGLSDKILKEAVLKAIDAEYAATDYYQYLIQKADSVEIQSFLEMLSFQENDHAQHIERMWMNLDMSTLDMKDDTHLETLENPPIWQIDEKRTLKEALSKAIEYENQSSLFFEAIADTFDEPVSSFFTTLSRTESQHAIRIEKMLDQV